MRVNEFLVSCPVVAVGPPQPESPLQVLAETSLIFFSEIFLRFFAERNPVTTRNLDLMNVYLN